MLSWKFLRPITLVRAPIFLVLLCFITLFYFLNLKGGGGCNPCKPLPSLDPPMICTHCNAMKLSIDICFLYGQKEET